MSDTSQGSGASGSTSVSPQMKKSKLKVTGCLPFSSLPGPQKEWPTAVHTQYIYMPRLHTTHTVQHTNTIAYRDHVHSHCIPHSTPNAPNKAHIHNIQTPFFVTQHISTQHMLMTHTETLKSAVSEFKNCKPLFHVVS